MSLKHHSVISVQKPSLFLGCYVYQADQAELRHDGTGLHGPLLIRGSVFSQGSVRFVQLLSLCGRAKRGKPGLGNGTDGEGTCFPASETSRLIGEKQDVTGHGSNRRDESQQLDKVWFAMWSWFLGPRSHNGCNSARMTSTSLDCIAC